MSALIRLTVTRGSQAGKIFEFEEPDKLLCGRLPDCKLCVPDDLKISRHHFLLEINPPEVLLQDLGSRNGTFLGDRRVVVPAGAQRGAPVEVRSGDTVRAGGTVLVVAVEQRYVCADCGVQRSPAAPGPLILIEGAWRCDRCESRGRKGRSSPRAQAAKTAPRCEQCGARASAEARAGEGSFLCEPCRRRIADGDRSAVKSLFSHAFGGLRELAAAAGAAAEPERDIAAYDIDRKLGDGRVGPVFLARRKASGEQFAIKVMAPSGAIDDTVLRRFEREVQVTMELRHPHIVRVVSHGRTNCVYYFVMEYLPGGDLEALLQSRGALPVQEAVSIVRQAAEGLGFAHAKGFVHRDLRPNDILLGGAPGRWTAKVADFGLATSLQRAGLGSGSLSIIANPAAHAFSPREKLTDYRAMTPASDVFALGAVLYHALTGKSVYGQTTGMGCVQAILDGQVVRVAREAPEIPRALAAVLDRCLAVDPLLRLRDGDALARALAGGA